MRLDLSSIEKAVDSLDAALRVAADTGFMSGLSAEQADTIRAGVIQKRDLSPMRRNCSDAWRR